ncbi:heparinase II/III domain-containing protein [Terasakiella pusilla]|uniref:heparinase II/III domain-containing protein n=1 Tax=Terasakiella pusilla TaxID=64973 RepID=UPI003AA7FB83
MANLRFLLKKAYEMPFPLLMKKVLGRARRVLRDRVQYIKCLSQSSYFVDQDATKLSGFGSLRFDVNEIGIFDHDTLRTLSKHYLRHEFNLLGSGWTHVQTSSSDINRSNRRESQIIRNLCTSDRYVPIDWQIDFKSGYRWSSEEYFQKQIIPVNQGADIKVPWELSRLQHLPQLALCAVVARQQREGFEESDVYAGEVLNQIVDFLASNPPKFGVNWVCPMDIGIRLANILLSIDLLISNEFHIPAEILSLVGRANSEHIDHILNHLEWSEVERSNHYLADIVGVVIGASYLETSPYNDAVFAFGAQELLVESSNQFLPDGGNYEGSTSYHRLSCELVTFAIARLLGCLSDKKQVFRNFDHKKIHVRAPFHESPLDFLGLLDAFKPKLLAAGQFCADVTDYNNIGIQVGDTDSGRLFKVEPTYIEFDGQLTENTLNFKETADAVQALFGKVNPDSVNALLVKKMSKENFLEPIVQDRRTSFFGDAVAIKSRFVELEDKKKRLRSFQLPEEGLQKLDVISYPDFGLYIYRNDNFFLSVRCCNKLHKDAPTGHTHDDNLSICLRIGEDVIASDPGSYVYTPSRDFRNLFRSIKAHDAPRAKGRPITYCDESYLFSLKHLAFAECILWREDAMAGRYGMGEDYVVRLIEIDGSAVHIWDYLDGDGELDEINSFEEFSFGYGCKKNTVRTL